MRVDFTARSASSTITSQSCLSVCIGGSELFPPRGVLCLHRSPHLVRGGSRPCFYFLVHRRVEASNGRGRRRCRQGSRQQARTPLKAGTGARWMMCPHVNHRMELPIDSRAGDVYTRVNMAVRRSWQRTSSAKKKSGSALLRSHTSLPIVNIDFGLK